MTEEEARFYADLKLANHSEEITQDLLRGMSTPDVPKDILIIVKDQLDYMRNCVNSIYEHTQNFNLFVWDNASQPDTKEYLESLQDRPNFHLVRVEKNEGFNEPNNRLAEKTSSPYIILLNSDTEVKAGWDKSMIGFLQENPKVKLVGYGGSNLDENCKGGGPVKFGYDADYVAGWCVCLSRETYNEFGLFDEQNLHFAYCEDSDLSLRIKEAGHKIYVLYADLVLHFENRTVKAVNKDEVFRAWFKQVFDNNHAYMRKRWQGKGLIAVERNKCAVSDSQTAESHVECSVS